MAAFYNPYKKMIQQLDTERKSSLKKDLVGSSPVKGGIRTLEATRARLEVDTADQIEEDKKIQQAAKAEINLNRTQAVDQAISAERAVNTEYILREQKAFQNHLVESATVRQETDRIWHISNAQAVERSRYIVDSVAQEQLEKESLKLRQTHVKLFTEQAKQAQIRQAIEFSRVAAEAALRDQLLLRSRLRGAYPF